MEHCQIRRPGEIKTSGLMLHILVLAAWIMCSEQAHQPAGRRIIRMDVIVGGC